jgi:hypothetical protein
MAVQAHLGKAQTAAVHIKAAVQTTPLAAVAAQVQQVVTGLLAQPQVMAEQVHQVALQALL